MSYLLRESFFFFYVRCSLFSADSTIADELLRVPMYLLGQSCSNIIRKRGALA